MTCRRLRRSSLRPAAGFLLAASILGGCTDGEGEGRARIGPPQVGDTLPTERLVDGAPRPWFAATTLDGDTVALADFRGGPLILNLWATWCLPCRTEIPHLQSLAQRHAGAGLQVVGISVDGRGAGEDVRAFLDEAGVTFTILHDPAMRSMDLFAAPGLPVTFLVDADGVVTFHRIGPVLEDDAAFGAAVEALVAGGSRAEGADGS